MFFTQDKRDKPSDILENNNNRDVKKWAYTEGIQRRKYAIMTRNHSLYLANINIY